MSGQTLLSQLATLSRDLDNAINGLAALEEQSAEADAAYKVAKARAYLRAEGTMPQREHQSNIECDTQYLEKERTAALVRVQRERIKALHTRIDVGRTMAATDRAMSGVGI